MMAELSDFVQSVTVDARVDLSVEYVAL